MSSAQLYKQWHLHILETDKKWLYVDWGMDMLARFSSEGRQLFLGILEVEFHRKSSRGYTFIKFIVNAKATANETEYDVKVMRAGNRACPLVQLTLTKDQIWRRLASAPGPEDWIPQVVFTSQASLSPHDFACAAQQLFSLLCLRHGWLQFFTEAENTLCLDTPCKSFFSHSFITFGIIPRIVGVAPDPNCACWTYEGTWSMCPPDLQFDRLALKYTSVQLVFVES